MYDFHANFVVDAVDEVAVGNSVEDSVEIVELGIAVRREGQRLEILVARTYFDMDYLGLELALYLFFIANFKILLA